MNEINIENQLDQDLKVLLASYGEITYTIEKLEERIQELLQIKQELYKELQTKWHGKN